MLNTILQLSAVVVGTLVLASCASRENGSESSDSTRADFTTEGRLTGRIGLAEVRTTDSAAQAQTLIVDRMLQQAIDSIEGLDYVPMEQIQQAAGEGDSTSVQAVGTKLNINGLLALRIARFGSVVGVDARLVDPSTGQISRHARSFSFIRFREENETKLMGPALYEGLDRAVRRLAAFPDSPGHVPSAQPLIIANVVVGKDSALGRIGTNRVKISKDGVRALGDFARWKYPEFVVFDYESRTRAYETVGLNMVEDHAAVGNLERKAMFALDIPYYLTSDISPSTDDSVTFGVALYGIMSAERDTLIDRVEATFERRTFETSTVEKDAITQLIEMAETLLARQSAIVRESYARSISH